MTALDCRTQLAQPGRQESLRFLATHPVSRVRIAVAGSPIIYPVRHHVVDSNAIVFRGDDVSEYADTSSVCMSLEAEGVDDGDGFGWYVRVRGVARDVVDPAELARLRELVPEALGAGPKTRWIQLRPETILGRRYTCLA
jgi:Pyridoxamine 5'-phosphate oxidase